MLPKHSFPTYTITLPISKKEIKFRPWVSVELKSMMTAKLSQDLEKTLDSISDIIQECVFDSINLRSDIPYGDLLYLYIHCKMKSKDEIISLNYNATMEDDGCSEIIPIDLDLRNISMTKIPNKEIRLTSELGIMMKYPSYELTKKIDDCNDDYKKIAYLVDYVFDKEKVYDSTSFTQEELVKWLQELMESEFDKLIDFYDNLPTITLTLENIGPKHKNIVLIGIKDFLF